MHASRRNLDSAPERSTDEGFTLIELLVVVIIIGILAAIALPAFMAIRDRSYRATVEADLRNGAVAMETSYSGDGRYPGSGDIVLPSSPGVGLQTFLVGSPVADQAFCLEGWHQALDGGAVAATYDQRAGGLTDNDSC